MGRLLRSLLLYLAACAAGCGEPPPMLAPDGGGPTSDAGARAPWLGEHVELPRDDEPSFDRFGIVPSAGWTSPVECPTQSADSFCEGCYDHTAEPWSLDRNEVGDRFGEAMAVGDFNGDGYPDLAVGAPGEQVGTSALAGAVYVYLGTVRGFEPWRTLHLNVDGVVAPAGYEFGSEIAAGDIKADGTDDLAIAVGPNGDGHIRVYAGSVDDLFLTTKFAAVDAYATDESEFGSALAFGDCDGDGQLDLVAGAPAEKIAGEVAGAVYVMFADDGLIDPTSSIMLDPSSLSSPADGMRFGEVIAVQDVSGSGVADIAVGVSKDSGVHLFEDGYTPVDILTDGLQPDLGRSLLAGDLDGTGPFELIAGGIDPTSAVAFYAIDPSIPDYEVWDMNEAVAGAPVGIGRLGSFPEQDLLARLADLSFAQIPVVGVFKYEPVLMTGYYFNLGESVPREKNDRFGHRVVLADTNGDALSDVVVAAPSQAVDGAGRVYVFSVKQSSYWFDTELWFEEWENAEYELVHSTGFPYGDPMPVQVVTQETTPGDCDRCVVLELPTGAPCGETDAEVCFEGACFERMGCGDGYREPSPGSMSFPREACDDANMASGDACSSTCTPTILTVSSRELCEDAPSRFTPSLAEDGAGGVLFVYTADEDELREVRARLFSSGGVPAEPDDELALVIADVGLGWDPQATAVGLATGGWVVAWTSPNADGDGAGIALRRVFMNGTLGPVSLLHSSDRLGAQSDPRLARVGDGLVVIWTDSSGTDGPLGKGIVMAQEYNAALGRVGGSFAISDPTRWASQPAVASTDADWVVAWTDTPEEPFEPATIYARRYGSTADAAPFVVTTDGASPSVATADDGSFLVAWVSRDTDWQGDIMTNTIAASGGPLGTPVAHALPGVQGAPTIAALAGGDYLVAYEEVGPRRGLAFGHAGAGTLAPESIDLETYLVDGLQGDVSLLRTSRGIWFAWSDASFDPDAYRSFLAFLLPLD